MQNYQKNSFIHFGVRTVMKYIYWRRKNISNWNKDSMMITPTPISNDLIFVRKTKQKVHGKGLLMNFCIFVFEIVTLGGVVNLGQH